MRNTLLHEITHDDEAANTWLKDAMKFLSTSKLSSYNWMMMYTRKYLCEVALQQSDMEKRRMFITMYESIFDAMKILFPGNENFFVPKPMLYLFPCL